MLQVGCKHDVSIGDFFVLSCANFVDPAAPLEHELELGPGGAESDLTVEGVPRFLALLAQSWFGAGTRAQVQALQCGLAEALPLDSLLAFTAAELKSLVCGEEAAWTASELKRYVKAGYGYTEDSAQILWLREELLAMGRLERASFVQFVTSCPRLPPGGLAALPKGPIVVDEMSRDGPELRWPTARTCTQQLRLPRYESREVLGALLRKTIPHSEGFGNE